MNQPDFYKWTTPAITFFCDFDISTITTTTIMEIAFAQRGTVKVIKMTEDISVNYENNSLNTLLTQEETSLFSPITPIEIQIRIKFDDDTVIASNIIKGHIGHTLKDGVL